jgi:hypothetical protein
MSPTTPEPTTPRRPGWTLRTLPWCLDRGSWHAVIQFGPRKDSVCRRFACGLSAPGHEMEVGPHAALALDGRPFCAGCLEAVRAAGRAGPIRWAREAGYQDPRNRERPPAEGQAAGEGA